MSTYNDANLIIINDGAYSGGIKSLKPADSDLSPTGVGDFTVDRNSEATYIGSDGLIKTAVADFPRFDFSGGVSCPSLLVERQSTNLLTYSEEFDNAAWSKYLTTVVADAAISPDGTQNADSLEKTGAFGSIFQSLITISNAVNYTLSVFVKRVDSQRVSFRLLAGTNDCRRYFDFDSETFGIAAGGNELGFVQTSFESLTNDWYRIQLTVLSNGVTGTVNIYSGQTGITTYDGMNYFWGACLEQSDYATSYIKTTGLTATRLADQINSSGDINTFNSNEGVLYAEIQAFADDSVFSVLSISNGGTSRVYLGFSVTNEIVVAYTDTGVNSAQLFSSGLDITQFNKVAFKYSEDDFALWINGVEVGTDVSGTTISSNVFDRLNLDLGDLTSDLYGRLKSLYVYNQVLSDSDLQTLTT